MDREPRGDKGKSHQAPSRGDVCGPDSDRAKPSYVHIDPFRHESNCIGQTEQVWCRRSSSILLDEAFCNDTHYPGHS